VAALARHSSYQLSALGRSLGFRFMSSGFLSTPQNPEVSLGTEVTLPTPARGKSVVLRASDL
jgi:hypothetical protein